MAFCGGHTGVIHDTLLHKKMRGAATTTITTGQQGLAEPLGGVLLLPAAAAAPQVKQEEGKPLQTLLLRAPLRRLLKQSTKNKARAAEAGLHAAPARSCPPELAPEESVCKSLTPDTSSVYGAQAVFQRELLPRRWAGSQQIG